MSECSIVQPHVLQLHTVPLYSSIIQFYNTAQAFLQQFSPSSTATRLKRWRSGSWLSDSGPLDFLVCCISRRDIKRSSYNKKQTLITSVMEIFSHISREAVRRGCIHFKLRLGMAICAKDNLTQEMEI